MGDDAGWPAGRRRCRGVAVLLRRVVVVVVVRNVEDGASSIGRGRRRPPQPRAFVAGEHAEAEGRRAERVREGPPTSYAEGRSRSCGCVCPHPLLLPSSLPPPPPSAERPRAGAAAPPSRRRHHRRRRLRRRRPRRRGERGDRRQFRHREVEGAHEFGVVVAAAATDWRRSVTCGRAPTSMGGVVVVVGGGGGWAAAGRRRAAVVVVAAPAAALWRRRRRPRPSW